MKRLLCLIFLLFIIADISVAASRKKTPSSVITNESAVTNLYDYIGPEETRPSAPSVFWSVLKSLFVIVILCVAAWIFLKWLSKKQTSGETNRDAFRIISRYSIAPGRSLCIVKILDSYAVIGLSENSISILKEIEDSAEIDKIKQMELALPSGEDSTTSFSDTLFSLLKRTGEEARSSDSILSFLKKQKDKLQRLKEGKKQ